MQISNAVGELPMHHRDPFGRIIIAQAKLEGLTIVTQDSVYKNTMSLL